MHQHWIITNIFFNILNALLWTGFFQANASNASINVITNSTWHIRFPNEIWLDNYSNTTSGEYLNKLRSIESQLKDLFNNYSTTMSITVLNIKKGSIIATTLFQAESNSVNESIINPLLSKLNASIWKDSSIASTFTTTEMLTTTNKNSIPETSASMIKKSGISTDASMAILEKSSTTSNMNNSITFSTENSVNTATLTKTSPATHSTVMSVTSSTTFTVRNDITGASITPDTSTSSSVTTGTENPKSTSIINSMATREVVNSTAASTSWTEGTLTTITGTIPQDKTHTTNNFTSTSNPNTEVTNKGSSPTVNYITKTTQNIATEIEASSSTQLNSIATSPSTQSKSSSTTTTLKPTTLTTTKTSFITTNLTIVFKDEVWKPIYAEMTDSITKAKVNELQNKLVEAFSVPSIIIYSLSQGSLIVNLGVNSGTKALTNDEIVSSLKKVNAELYVTVTTAPPSDSSTLPVYAIALIALFVTLAFIAIIFVITVVICRHRRIKGYGQYQIQFFEMENGWKYGRNNSVYQDE